mmetsp:Transcript_84514/g.176835  ORF Transcript_84514/g.176835 Transcript_84514/m.176835 type:complete len:294 (-) Transcript_84514:189-1070(-)|eukprot:CAMPEP_0206445002 /NCGR_PEP_ID=MMETSP0324_2-20121206/15236_1 /ASSEMBLY_ACC=CAM_ASM_000836 /TAXON_ID=2866 /ORGANISM="Crypthecodinium cohnii, Strain Seligo" /LENGTH=293 /DNA_ID=CAMNT_0053913109 /DNA_START=78 /DNA_END=959 /DNA_ORIENTATION=-
MRPSVAAILFAIVGVHTLGSTDAYKVRFNVANLQHGATGSFTVEVHPNWAPLGAARFKELVEADFFQDVRFFRVIHDFMAQFGISGTPSVAAKWRQASISDDPNKVSNTRGRLTYAMAGPNTRTTQLFINFKDNAFLDNQGFSPIGEVVEGMNIVDELYSSYGEGPPSGRGPNQQQVQTEGNTYLTRMYPHLSYIKSVEFLDALDETQEKFESEPVVTPADVAVKGESSSQGFTMLAFACLALSGLACWFYAGRSSGYSKPVSDLEACQGEELRVPGSTNASSQRKRGVAVPE